MIALLIANALLALLSADIGAHAFAKTLTVIFYVLMIVFVIMLIKRGCVH